MHGVCVLLCCCCVCTRVCGCGARVCLWTRSGNQLGKRLTASILGLAVGEFRYTRAVLDTLERLPAAVRLYTGLGFDRIEAYCHNPLHDAVYMGTPLPWRDPAGAGGAGGVGGAGAGASAAVE